VRVQPGEAVPSGALGRLLLRAGLTAEEFTALL
jgi:hypothetical protein